MVAGVCVCVYLSSGFKGQGFNYEFNTSAGGYIFFSQFSDYLYASVRR